MPYNLQGVALHNPALGWKLLWPTKPLSDLVRSRASVVHPGTDGVQAGMPGLYGAPVLPFVVRTVRDGLETLLALFAGDGWLTYDDAPDRRVAVEMVSWSSVGYGPRDSLVDVTFLVRLPGVYWRSVDTTTSAAVPLGAASVPVPALFPGQSAPVQDAIIRVRGGFTGLRVTDSKGSWWTFDTVASGHYIRFHAELGRVWATTTDTWSGGTEVSGRCDFGGPRDVFEICPTWTTDPTVRSGSLTVTTDTRSGSPQIEVRGRAAYLV